MHTRLAFVMPTSVGIHPSLSIGLQQCRTRPNACSSTGRAGKASFLVGAISLIRLHV